MTEVNERWRRDHRNSWKLIALGAACAAILWPISYNASLFAAQTGQGLWFTFVSGVSLLGAFGATIGTVIGLGHAVTDDPPLPGSNG
jgi:hypothetical protein